jgi:hypothetical protein
MVLLLDSLSIEDSEQQHSIFIAQELDFMRTCVGDCITMYMHVCMYSTGMRVPHCR